MSKLTQISLNAKIRNVYAKNLSKLKLMPKKECHETFSVLDKNQIFLNETDGRRLEIKLQGK